MTLPADHPKPQPLEYGRPGRGKARPGRSRGRTAILGLLAGLLFLMLLSALLPYGDGGREQAYRVKCASNMKVIGLGAITYANDHGGQLPDDLQVLLRDQDLDLAPSVFNCPDTHDTPANGPTTQATVSDFVKPGHLSYIYVGKGLKADAPADVVILYEPLKNHANDGMNVLFVDGHVESLSSTEAQSILKQAAGGVRPIRYPAVAAPAPGK